MPGTATARGRCGTIVGTRHGTAPGTGPSRAELAACYGATVPDVGRPGIGVLLVGINPSLYSGWSGNHFARPGNRLWRTLYEAGLTDRLLTPGETEALTAAGLGITNLVARATARADELSHEEIKTGVYPLRRLARSWRPALVAFLGISAYRVAFGRPGAGVGRQHSRFEGAAAWVLPNPSGLNAHYQQPALTSAYAELAWAVPPAGPAGNQPPSAPSPGLLLPE
jgi:double-stranded uracil-DNA glycosylase